MNSHIITREIGNLRGFSTSSIFTRPSNVATDAINLQRAPDDTHQLRRGYQCQIGEIGGMGLGTSGDPAKNQVQTACVGMDGFLYNKLTKQVVLSYDGRVMGTITGATNANPAVIHSVAHGQISGTVLIIRGINGMTNLNNQTYTITLVDADHFSLNGVDSTTFPAYISGGNWSVAFADMGYLTFSIFVDPRYIYNNAAQSITCNILVNRAAQINGNQATTNTVTVFPGFQLIATDVIRFYSSDGVLNQRNITSVTTTSITFDGAPVSVLTGVYIKQFVETLFGKGFDSGSGPSIYTWLLQILDPATGIYGLHAAVNGDINLPAAFLQIVEPTIIGTLRVFSMDYWYWNQVNSTISPPLPGSANPLWQNSEDFENASLCAFKDVIYIANGWDYPQKYDGQTVYRAGMPLGIRPLVADNTTFLSLPFTTGNTFQYAITYQQIDARGNLVEGEISEVWKDTVVAAAAANDVTVTNLMSTLGANWNTNGALAVGGAASVYGPDSNGFYYDLVALTPGFTLKIGDSAYYGDTTAAVLTGGAQTDVITMNVVAGHAAQPGDILYFFDALSIERRRLVASVTATTITIKGDPVTVDDTIDPDHANILIYKVSQVFGNVAIIDGNQSDVNTVNVLAGHTIQLGDILEFLDTQNNVQRRQVSAVGATTVQMEVFPFMPVSVSNLTLMASINQRADALNFQRKNSGAATLSTGVAGTISNAISNNLRINIYRTKQGESFTLGGSLFLFASIPNDSSGAGTQIYIDGIPDAERGGVFGNPSRKPNPPPISKYLKSFGNQMFYAGGKVNSSENSDRVFFSEGNSPEVTPLAINFFQVPNVDDDVTGIGVSGSTVVTTKNNSLWAATGNFLTGQIDVVQIAPGNNIGCIAHATIASVGSLMYFLHTNGVYAITENQLFPTDAFGNPLSISLAVQLIFRETKFLPQTRYVLKRAVAVNFQKENQYLLFLPCEDVQTTMRTANIHSIILCYDYQEKNWFQWDNMNAAGGMIVIDDDLYFQERRTSSFDGNVANFYKQHRFYRLVDHADHAGPQKATWTSSWEDLGQPEVRKKFCRCVLLMDRLSQLMQFNNPDIQFASYLDRKPGLKNTIADISQTDNVRNSAWSTSGWGWNYWSGYQDSFVTVNLKQGTVAKSMQVGFTIQGINMDIRLAGFQLEAIPENRKTVVR